MNNQYPRKDLRANAFLIKGFRVLLFGFALLTQAGCAHSDVQQYGEFDASQKTMTVPAGGGLSADFKGLLKKNGWEIVVDRGPQVVEGKLGAETHLEKYGTFRTRYRMALSFRQVDLCMFTFDPLYVYDLSVIDNQGGNEVVIMNGRDCSQRIVDRFDSVLKGEQK